MTGVFFIAAEIFFALAATVSIDRLLNTLVSSAVTALSLTASTNLDTTTFLSFWSKFVMDFPHIAA